MGGASSGVVEADGVAVVCPDVSEASDEVVVGVIVPHFSKKIAVAYAELLQNGLKSDKGQFCLEEVGPVEAVQTVSAKHTRWLL